MSYDPDKEGEIEAANRYECRKAAQLEGYAPEKADACDDGELLCPTCPFKPADSKRCPKCGGEMVRPGRGRFLWAVLWCPKCRYEEKVRSQWCDVAPPRKVK